MTTPASSLSSDASMKDKAGAAADEGRQAAGQVAQTAVEQAQDLTQQAVRQARDLAGEARGHLTEQAGQQHRAIVDTLRSIGTELGSMSDNNTEPGMAGELVSQAHTRVTDAADWLDSRDPAQLLDELRQFARQRPVAFLAGALVAGVVAGRLTRGVVDAHASAPEAGAHTALDRPTAPVAPAGYPTRDSFADPIGEHRAPVSSGYGDTSTYGVGGSDTAFLTSQAGNPGGGLPR